MIKLTYNMSKDYCSEWTAIEALREIVQNAIDSGKECACEFNDKVVKVTTKDTKLEPHMFALGVSEKNGKAIGKYGEGFKLAMLVLTRLGLNPQLFSASGVASGAFIKHEFTNVEEFCILIEEVSKYSDDLVFICDIDHIDTDLLCERVTPFAEHPLPTVRGDVEILYTRPGQIYVNGLWVCENSDLTYGYNFSPDYIELNRDRNMVNGLAWQLGKYYGNTKNYSLIFNLLENDAFDVSNLQYHMFDKDMKAELARLFFNKYGDGAKIGKPTVSYYGSSHVSYGHNAYNTLSKCGIQEQTKAVSADSPLGIMLAFKEKHKKRMRRDLRNSFDSLINQAKGW